jgi:hypothetical protein
VGFVELFKALLQLIKDYSADCKPEKILII